MNISSVGASQSLDLTALLAKLKSAKSTSSSGTTATTDTLSLSVQAQLLSGTQSSNPFQSDFENLGKLIDSGDLAGAKKAYAAMQAKLQAHQSDQGGTDPLAAGLAAIGAALDSGDATAAQAAWKAMQTQLASLGGASGAGSGTNPMEKDLAQLGQLIDSGDLAGAKALFQTMQERMKAHQPPPQDGSTSQKGTDPTTSLAAIGSALASGDLSTAKEAWAALLKELQNSSGTALA